MTDDSDRPTCPDCGHSLMAISPWWYVCQKLTCQKKVPRYEWVEE